LRDRDSRDDDDGRICDFVDQVLQILLRDVDVDFYVSVMVMLQGILLMRSQKNEKRIGRYRCPMLARVGSLLIMGHEFPANSVRRIPAGSLGVLAEVDDLVSTTQESQRVADLLSRDISTLRITLQSIQNMATGDAGVVQNDLQNSGRRPVRDSGKRLHY